MATAQSILDRKGTYVATISPDASVLDAAKRMNESRIGSLVVLSGDRAVGIFTERDILTRVVAAERPPASTRVGDVMTTPTLCCRPSTSIDECKSLMTSHRVRHVPVVDDGRLAGMVSQGDIMHTEAAEKQTTLEYLHDYLHGRM